MIIIVFLCGLIFPIVFLLNMPPLTQQLVTISGFGVGAIVTLVVLFGPKVYILYSGMDMNADFGVVNLNRPGKGRATKIAPETGEGLISPGHRQVAPSSQSITIGDFQSIETLLKGHTTDTKVRLCMEHINLWQQALLKYNDESSSNSHHGSAPASKRNSEHPVLSTHEHELDHNFGLMTPSHLVSVAEVPEETGVSAKN